MKWSKHSLLNVFKKRGEMVHCGLWHWEKLDWTGSDHKQDHGTNQRPMMWLVMRPMMWLLMRPMMQPMIHHMFQSLIQFMIWCSLIWYDPVFVNTAVVSTSLSTLSHNYFCMYMYLIIAVRFRCWSFDLTVVHIHTCSRLCSTGAWLPKGTEF